MKMQKTTFESFTFLDKETIDALIEHKEVPHLRLLQKKIGEEVTLLVHGDCRL